MQKPNLNREELLRYNRHLLIPDFGLKSQLKLRNSKVVVIGAGGLGSPVLLYLAAAGVGTIGIIDADSVDHSNLQRQILYDSEDIGKRKVQVAAERVRQLNPNVKVLATDAMLTSQNALNILEPYDLVIDGTDNFPTRYLVNDACLILGKPLVYGSIFQFEGQASVFNLLESSGKRGPNYRDLFPEPPPPGMVPSCAEGGVLGVLPGIIGSMQANEAIKILAGIGETLSGRLFIYDALSFSSVTLKVAKNPNLKPVTELIDYEIFCGITPQTAPNEDQEISPERLAQIIQLGDEKLQLIDVRQPHEYDSGDIGGEKMPLDQLDRFLTKINRSGKVVLYCRSGERSKKAIKDLVDQHGFNNLLNLRGGLIAYLQEVD
ncbi:MAG: molybdopterin-synthase adenylyltransferase MoeB [Saprospiraceae bacterium]|nr:molybdopterin-synthase adenylyltransferase MoeB [Saprospiraceae bacterium]